ncbi:MAG: Peptidoglycan/LPS O-acetylase OafA/YrhL, contains acyltransferase and SGNH-hydrolase domain [Mucilaginibacter sp.]|nr:Peptidoglycan/LPS O-acetylase OafA/YrhL, contains acyltransferase and SGNH-hydrolase domain [Mucilaginibacter sp.]
MPIQVTDTIAYPSNIIKENYYPSLNGLRGLSIILVVMFHLGYSDGRIFNGPLGVNIFFVLSGFLITTLCIKEINLTNTLSLRSFYYRRFLRIFPAAYLYITIVLILNLILTLNIAWYQFAAAYLYIMNFSYFRSHHFAPYFGHYWSLSIEEQFYLLFPFLLKISRRFFVISIVFIVFVLPVFCLVQYLYEPLNKGILYAFTHYFIKFQAIAVGCLFSVLTINKTFDSIYLSKTKVAGNLIAIFLIFYLNYDNFYSIKAVYVDCCISMLTGYIIVSNLVSSKDVFFRLFNFKPLVILGILSYSIYIWHVLFLANDLHFSKYLISYPYNLIWIVSVPCLSYYGFERYFLKLKKHFKRV